MGTYAASARRIVAVAPLAVPLIAVAISLATAGCALRPRVHPELDDRAAALDKIVLLQPSVRLIVDDIDGDRPVGRDKTDEFAFRLSLAVGDRLEAHGFDLAAAEDAVGTAPSDDETLALMERSNEVLDRIFARRDYGVSPRRHADKRAKAGEPLPKPVSRLGTGVTLGDGARAVASHFGADAVFLVRVRGVFRTKARMASNRVGLFALGAVATGVPSYRVEQGATYTVESALVDGRSGEILWAHRESQRAAPHGGPALEAALDATFTTLPPIAAR